ncbi:C40 family peptidase [Arthrobacter sp. ERGS1:01]|uniref:C40 family peptidase n=1 Tax=Arthrobacter sp. ERGS1:01 TaxID=1704044 RepID=UPI0006B47974|nr:C40 family peptidase [Arthrobacter sp. ERGS1:01]
MAVICTLLASAGFVGAGYASTSAADAATATAAEYAAPTPTPTTDIAAGFDSFAAQGLGVKVSFANTLIMAQKPKPKQLFDLTSPNGNTPQFARSAAAMRGDVPEISAAMISTVRKEILAAAYEGLGHSYVWGGTSFTNGWDCSGFVQWAYAQAGVALPRTEQWVPMVQTNNPQPGDLVVQNPDGPDHWSHIGIYVGDGEMISALNPSVGTILHTPQSTSNSSAYFTMPGFAAQDELAAKAAKEKTAKEKAAKDKATLKAASSTKPAKTATAKPSKSATPSAKPSETPSHPATTPPGTKPPVTTPPGTTPPVTTPPGTKPPVTTPPVITPPGTTPPGTTPPATVPTEPSSPSGATPSESATPSTEAAQSQSQSVSPDSASTSAGPDSSSGSTGP